jgi:hypothetical protein
MEMYIEHKNYETLGHEPNLVNYFLDKFLYGTRSYDEFGEGYSIEETFEQVIAEGAFREGVSSELIKVNKRKLFYNLIAKNFNYWLGSKPQPIELDPDTKEYVREQIEDASKKEYLTYADLDNANLAINESVVIPVLNQGYEI